MVECFHAASRQNLIFLLYGQAIRSVNLKPLPDVKKNGVKLHQICQNDLLTRRSPVYNTTRRPIVAHPAARGLPFYNTKEAPHMAVSRETVLFYQPADGTQGALLKPILARMGVRIKNIAPDAVGQTVGCLLGRKGFDARENP